jgi:protein-disulfide isomerase
MKERFEVLATALIAVAAVALSATAIWRELRPRQTRGSARPLAPEYTRGWERLSTGGVWIGDSTARVQIIEFGDFECPFCKKLHTQLRSIQSKFGQDVAVQWVHFPLPTHRFAMPAARASMCAETQGSFRKFHNALFEKQDSLGLKSWTSYALDAEVIDTNAFRDCIEQVDLPSGIRRGLTLGDSLGVEGTPTILINGWRYSTTPYDSLDAIVRRGIQKAGGR